MDDDGSAPSPAGAAGTVTPIGEPPPSPELLVTLLAEPSAASMVRDRLRGWLACWWWPDGEVDDIVMAVNEAVANVVDHAYARHPVPGHVHVYAWIVTDPAGRRVAVSVTDRGRWRPVPPDPGHRGRGLLMMSVCMASVHIERGSGGTAVTMISASVPVVAR